MMYARDFRAGARQALKGKWGVAVAVGFVANLLTGGVAVSGTGSGAAEGSGYLSFVNQDAFVFVLTVMAVSSLLALVIGGAVQLGWFGFHTKLVKGEEVRFGDLFSNFHRLWTGFAMKFVVGLFVLLWSLVLVIPGIVAMTAMGVINVDPILDTQTADMSMTMVTMAAQIILAVAVLSFPGIIAQYRYAMVPYLMAEFPELKIMDAIRESKRLMKGNKWRLFCLQISFFGWSLLAVLSCGIGNLWLIPYMYTAEALFYMEVTGRGRPVNPEQ